MAYVFFKTFQILIDTCDQLLHDMLTRKLYVWIGVLFSDLWEWSCNVIRDAYS